MQFSIRLDFFFVFYLFFCLIPLFFSSLERARAYLFVFFFISFFLTFFSVRFMGGEMVFSLLKGRGGVDFCFSAGNLFLNLALGFPLGEALYLFKKTASQTFFLGGLFASAVELFQLVFPLSRVVDPLDIVFCALGSLLGFLFMLIFAPAKTRKS